MSGLHKQYKTDTDKEISGIEVTFEEAMNDDGTVPTFIVARMGGANKAYSKAFESAIRPYRRQLELQTLKEEIAEEIDMEVFVNNALKGWKNVQDENGKEIPFSKSAAIQLLKELPEVFKHLKEEAKIYSNFKAYKVEEEVKN